MAVAAGVRPSVNHFPAAPPQERDAVELVAACVESFEQGLGPDFRERCERFYKQYRSFHRLRNAWERASEPDRDEILVDSKKTWGANLHIPLSYRTIETMVPRAVAQRPQLLYLPRKPEFETNVDTVRHLIDAQQEQIDIDLAFQAVMRSGRIYGLGVGKPFWRREWASRRRVKQRMFRPGQFVTGRLEREKVFDDPDFEDVDVFDFMWDPMGSSMRGTGRARWAVHRVWMDLEGCIDRIRDGTWNTESARAMLDDPAFEDKLRSMGNGQKYTEVWAERMAASGFNAFHLSARGEHIHEVWEWHDGERVLTVLDRQLLVQDAENPCVGLMPFAVYRPTPLQKQMVGIGDMEPLEHIQRELDTLRSQRRDAATIALCAGYAYDDAAIDEEDLEFGPAAAIRVRNAGDIRNALMPLQVRDVPGSAWQDEQVIRQDFDVVSGISDALDPTQGGNASTATEAQLVQASLSARIELGSRRFEIEVVRNVARCFLRLDQRMILENRDPIRRPDEGLDTERAAAEGRWQWFPVGPGELQGEFEIIPEGGSMAAKNVPQDRQDALQVMQLFGRNPFIDQRRPLLFALKKFGVSDPEAWLKRAEAPVPPAAIDMLKQAGVDPRLVDLAVQRAQAADPQLSPEGPDQAQVAQMMGAQS